jgi:molybdopterin molybdotransferase
VSPPLSPREAALQILAHLRRQPPLRVPLDDALDGVLAEDIVSPLAIPAWANSAMDGYAVRGADVRGASAAAPRTLTVIERIPAGGFPSLALSPGTCARIFTGAPVPEGADSVIRQEDTDGGAETVTIRSDRDVGVNIRAAGEDIQAGSTVLAEGTELGPAELGVLASLAMAKPMIYRRPRVAILGGGDELVDIDQPDFILSGKKIASSNTHALMALVRRAGGEPVSLGIARDTPESLRQHLLPASECDLLITTAGISVGEHDHLRTVLADLGARLIFWKVKMRPGAQTAFGLLGDLPWIGLPGNPVSTMVTFEVFARAAIRMLSGRRHPFRRTLTVRTRDLVHVAPGMTHFLRAVLAPVPGAMEARLTGPQGSGLLTSMVKANALLIIPEGQQETPAGSELQAIPLADANHQSEPPF